MRLKTLGVVLVTVLALFTVLYWVTDDSRRTAIAAEHEEELLAYGDVIFSNDPAEPAAAGCANCHGADGTGGDPDAAVIGPNLHSRRVADKLKANSNYVPPRRQLWRRRRLRQRQLADAGLELRGRWPAQRAADRGGRHARRVLGG